MVEEEGDGEELEGVREEYLYQQWEGVVSGQVRPARGRVRPARGLQGRGEERDG